MRKVIVTYETQDQAQRAVAELGEHDHMPRVSRDIKKVDVAK